MAIRNVRHGGLRRFIERGDASKLHPAHRARIRRILELLARPDALELLAAPTYRLQRLRGNRRGQWAVLVSRTWRIVFRFERGNALDVDLTDYH